MHKHARTQSMTETKKLLQRPLQNQCKRPGKVQRPERGERLACAKT